ncbi:hypothetical protein [Fructobacillus ficulneus]|uniref:Uncharacterized protein n=1 Tax=Fructobacillus ficulneus TaxID=157463 RepID=A0A0K8MIV0_9LACO|nr:hypothetical protein [Fructobacillus ficulneus]GAP00393.1 hypothetical protein FFIC_284100 [Fructobacillus ficulneus]
MTNEDLVQELLQATQPLFKKAKNTVYELRVVNQTYSNQVNFFFEWGLVGRSTISRQIKTVPRRQITDLDALIASLRRQSPVRITLA